VVSDEISQDLEEALRGAVELNLAYVELGSVWGRSVTSLEREEVARARRLLAEYGLRVNMIAAPTFKVVILDEDSPPFAQWPEYQEHRQMLTRSIEIALELEAPLVRTFSFRRPGMVGFGNPSPRLPKGGPLPQPIADRIVEALGLAAEECQKAGLTLALENVRSCWGNTGENAAKIVDAVGSPALKMVWDPTNTFVSGGVDYPDGFAAVRGRICDVHVKDASLLDAESGLTRWECVGRGEVRWPEQVAALKADGYFGPFTIETHWQPEDGSNGTAATTAAFRQILAALGS